MPAEVSQSQALNLLSEASRSSVEGLRRFAEDANSLAERLGASFEKLQSALSALPASAASESAGSPSGDRLALPLLADFARRSRAVQHGHELPSLLASSAARLAPRVMLFARRGHDLVAWDGFVRAEPMPVELRGTRVSLAALRDVAEALDEGQVYSYAGHLEAFYRQLPDAVVSSEVGATCLVPVNVAGTCIGVLCADSPDAGSRIEELPLVLLSQQAGTAMELLLRSGAVEEAVSDAEPGPVSFDSSTELEEEGLPEGVLAAPEEVFKDTHGSESWLLDEPAVATELPAVSETTAAQLELPDSVLSDSGAAAASVLNPEGITAPALEEAPVLVPQPPPALEEPSWGDEPAGGGDDLVWDIDDAFGGPAAATSSADDEFEGFHRDAPAQPEIAMPELYRRGEPISDDEGSEEERAARKLARVIVQDIILYNKKKIEQGTERGNVGAPLADDIHRGAQHFKSKTPAHLYPRRYFWDALVDILAQGRPELLSTLDIEF
jgi:hypothetical protein